MNETSEFFTPDIPPPDLRTRVRFCQQAALAALIGLSLIRCLWKISRAAHAGRVASVRIEILLAIGAAITIVALIVRMRRDLSRPVENDENSMLSPEAQRSPRRIFAGIIGAITGAILGIGGGVVSTVIFVLLTEETQRNPGAQAQAVLVIFGFVPMGILYGAYYGSRRALKRFDRRESLDR